MANRKIGGYWESALRSAHAEHPDWGSVRLAKALLDKQRQLKPEQRLEAGDPPSERTIRDRLPTIREDPALAEYTHALWPESFESGDLPWEAGPSFLELLRHDLPERPTLRLARAFYQVTVSAPALELEERHHCARLISNEAPLNPDVPRVQELRAWEGLAAHLPFDETHAKAYGAALKRGDFISVLAVQAAKWIPAGERLEQQEASRLEAGDMLIDIARERGGVEHAEAAVAATARKLAACKEIVSTAQELARAAGRLADTGSVADLQQAEQAYSRVADAWVKALELEEAEQAAIKQALAILRPEWGLSDTDVQRAKERLTAKQGRRGV